MANDILYQTRVDAETAAAFEHLASTNGDSAAGALRKLMMRAVRPSTFDAKTAHALLRRASVDSLDLRDVIERLIDAVDRLNHEGK